MKQVLQMEHNMVENSNLAKEFELKKKIQQAVRVGQRWPFDNTASPNY